jgi:cytidylate kinase
MIIAISGPPGSGKTTIALELSKKLNISFISAGRIFRKVAADKGLSIIELNRLAEKNIDIDREIDFQITTIVKKVPNIVIESHIAAWLLNNIADYKIYLSAPIHVRAKRIADRDKISYSDALKEIINREWSHYIRFKKYYGIDITDLSIFDLVINTANLSVTETVEFIYNFIKLSGKQLRLTLP